MVGQASEAEHREMEDFAVWALGRTLAGIFPLPAYQELGFGKAELDEIKQFRRDARPAATRPPSASTSAATCMTAWSATCARSA